MKIPFFNDEELIVRERELREELLHCKDEDEQRRLNKERKKVRTRRKRQVMIRRAVLWGVILILAVVIICQVGILLVNGVRLLFGGGAPKAKQQVVTELPSDSETETETEKVYPPGKVEVLMSFTGDCILGTDESFAWDTGFNAYYENYGGEYFLQNVRSLFEKDDLTIVNMEGTLTEEITRAPKEFAFKGDPEFIDILTTASVEAANVANNHSHDYGDKSFQDTVNILETNGIKTFGYDDTAILDVKGYKIGFFGIYELDDHLERIPQMESCIGRLKAKGADVIVGVFHWSNELETVPDENQRTLAHMAIDQGVDLVLGHHPHVVQGIEEYKGKTIAYSLGNFCFGGNSHPTEFETMILQQKFVLENGKIVDRSINVIPCLVSSQYDINNYQPMILEGDEAKRVLGIIDERSEAINETYGTNEE